MLNILTINIKKILVMTKSGSEKGPRRHSPSITNAPSGRSCLLTLHGRPDERVVKTLDILRAAMIDQGRLLVIDCLQPRPGHESALAQAQVLDDLNMLVPDGRARAS